MRKHALLFVSCRRQAILTTAIKKFLGVSLVCLCLAAQAWGQSGTTGPLTWSYANGTLTISGTGAMPHYTSSSSSSSSSSCPWYNYRSSITTVNIQYGVTTIGYYAFYNCSSLTSVTIGNSVTTIGQSAFSGCSSLASITIPNSVTTIGHSAFSSCSSLTSITIPNSVTTIGQSAFFGCRSLPSITIPNSVTTIGHYAFSSCSSLTSITIPNSVTTIGGYAFSTCSSLTSITIPNSVTTIGNYAFNNCSSLTSITIPNSVTSIGDLAFSGCSSLTSITVSSGNTAYASEDGVLFNKSKTAIISYPEGKTGSYDIPNSVTTIGSYAFGYCSSLTSITVPNSVTTIGNYAFSDCSSLTSITIPNSVTTIGGGAFYGCSSLTSITIGNSVTTIGSYAFYYCSNLTSITIPNSVTTIGSYAFSDCISLRNVTVLRTSPPSITTTGSSATFYGVPLSSATLTVPQGSKPAYQAAVVWKDFGTITEVVVEEPATEEPTLSVDTDAIAFGHDDTTPRQIYVTCDTTYVVSAYGNWITLDTLSGNGDGYFNVSVIPNPGTPRCGTIFVSTGASGDTIVTIVVHQSANPRINVSTDRYYGSQLGSSLFFDADDSQGTTVTVTAYTEWTVEKDSSWIILDPASPTGNGTGTFTVRAAANPGGVRTGDIRVINGDTTVTIVVTQSANPRINVSADSLFFDAYDSQDTTVTVTAYTDWTVVKDTSWIVLNPTSPSGSIPGTFSVRAADNDSTAREGHITITKGDSIKFIIVIQAANPAFNVPAEEEPAVEEPAAEEGTFIEDGIKYSVNGEGTVSVIAKDGGYSGQIDIPATVEYGGVTYTVTKIADGAFENNFALVSVTFPNTIVEIEQYAFFNAKYLTSITLPGSLTTIGEYAFEHTALTAIDIPASVTSLNDSFRENTNYVSVVVHWDTPLSDTGNEGLFDDAIYTQATLIVPVGTVDAYKAVSPWNRFVNIVENTVEGFSVSKDTIDFGREGNFQAVTVTTNGVVEWVATEDVDWLSIVSESGTGNGSFLVVAEANKGAEREAVVTVATADATIDIYVSQEAAVDAEITFEVEGITYYAPDRTAPVAEVAAPLKGSYSGEVIIPAKVTYLGVGYDVTGIGAGAFANSELTDVTLPRSIKTVGEDAFVGNSIKTITIEWTIIGDAYPDGIKYSIESDKLRSITLIVPSGTTAIYKPAFFWGDFGKIVEGATGVAKVVESAVTVRAEAGRLYIDSPAAEMVYVYSFTGKLLYTATKASGLAIFNAPSEKLLIVRGTSGWARKLMVNY